MIYFLKLPRHTLKSSAISCLSLSILFKADHVKWYALAAAIMVLAKFIVTDRGKHFINPANFAIIATILISGHAWISPGQWGAETQLIFLVGALGFWVSSRVNRMDVAIAFFISFAGLQAYRTIGYLHWPLDHLAHQLSTGSLLLFTFFMITDPVPSPQNTYVRWIWGMGIGMFSFALGNYYFVQGAPLWALFAFSFLTPFLNRMFSGTPFRWLPTHA